MNTLKFGNGEWYGKEGTILAYNDENYNYKPLPFKFERDSSATVINKDGLIETVGSGIPRIDFLGNTQGALKLEPQRTNLSPYSEDLNNFSTSNLNVTINPNQITSPSGNLADKVEENNVDGSHAIRRLSGISVTAAQDYAFSFFAKKDERSIVGISNTIGGAGKNAFIDIENGVILSSDFNDSSIDNYGNGWYKISLTDTATNTTDYDVRIYTSTQDGDFSHQGVVGYGFYIWGISVEQGSYATSYIPTQGSAVTRLSELNPFEREDLVSKNLIGNTEMVWFLDAYIFNRSGTSVSPKIESTANGNIFIGLNVGSTTLNIRHKDGTSASNTSSVPFTNGQRVKIAVKIIGTSATAFINGTNVGSFTSAAISNFNEFSSTNGNPYNINDLRFYNTILTDAELIALTS